MRASLRHARSWLPPLTRNAAHSALSRQGRGLVNSLLVARSPSPLAGEGGAKRRVRGARREFLNFVDGASPANGKDSAWSTSDRVR
jgi:hypothetical protein